MLNNFIYAKSKAMFEERIAEVPNEAIVFVEDTKEIWTHGTYFDCSTLDPSIIPNIQTEIDELRMSFNNKADADGNYPDMTVGFAEDLGGAEFTQESEFTIRATADGETVKDGAARIKSIKGNSLVWNQLFGTPTEWWLQFDIDKFTHTKNGSSYVVSCEDFTNPQGTDMHAFLMTINIKFFNSHTYLFVGDVKGEYIYQTVCGLYDGTDYPFLNAGATSNPLQCVYFYTPQSTFESAIIRFDCQITDGNYTKAKTIELIPQIYDLTQMFGAGNEPTTLEEFYARIPMGIDTSAYNQGEVIHCNIESITSSGINLFNKNKAIRGYIDENDQFAEWDSADRFGYLMKCLPGESYFFKNVMNGVMLAPAWFYDSNMNYIKYGLVWDSYETAAASGIITVPSNATYMVVMCNENYIDSCEVCILTSDFSSSDAHLYSDDTLDLSIVNTYFLDGIKSVGTVRDEIRYNKATGKWEAVKRIGEAVMDSFNWAYQGVNADYPYGFFYTNPNLDLTDKAIGGTVLCKLYSDGGFNVNKSIASNPSNKMVYVKDSSYTNVESFKTAMSGVILYYELATPIVTEIEDPGFSYQVWNGGTENIMAEKSTPLVADITYNFSANEWIKQNRFAVEDLMYELDDLNQTVSSATTWKNTELVGNTVSISAMVPNTFYYNNSEVTSFTISNFDVTDSPRDLYKCAFKTSSNGTTVSLPVDVYWANGTMPVINPDTIYELSIERSLGVYKAIIVSFNLV